MRLALIFRLGGKCLAIVCLLAGPAAGLPTADPAARHATADPLTDPAPGPATADPLTDPAPGPATADPREARQALAPLLLRITSFLRRNELDGITLDSRYAMNPTEIIRLSVVSQLLAYNDLYAVHQTHRYRNDVVDRADFLLEHFDEIRSYTAFDGMLGYALLGAYENTGDARYLDRGREIVASCQRLSGFTITLNWGLMAGLALAKYYHLTGDPASLAKTLEIVRSLDRYQHPDGSFPHYCPGSTDIHYTGWMGMELMHIARYVDEPRIQTQLEGIHRFISDRVGSDGITRYEELCPNQPNCWIYYYSIATGCGIDADTRGWNNELGYNAMVFDRFRDAGFQDVMRFLNTLEDHGGFADKWDYFPLPGAPEYVWANGDPSVIRTSVIFWSLASIYRDRVGRRAPRRRPPDDDRPLAGVRRGVEDPTPLGEPLPGPVAGESEAWRRYRWSVVDSLVLAGADPEMVCRAQVSSEVSPRRPSLESGEEVGADLEPALDRLGPVFPQPARGAASLQFRLARASEISLSIYDAGGRLVRELASGSWALGTHRVVWDGRDETGRPSQSGLYWVRLRAATRNHSLRLVFVR